jgi:hypothetical protein
MGLVNHTAKVQVLNYQKIIFKDLDIRILLTCTSYQQQL